MCLAVQMWPEGLAGVEVKVEGFAHKLPLLVASVTRQLVGLQVPSSRRHTRMHQSLPVSQKNPLAPLTSYGLMQTCTSGESLRRGWALLKPS